MSAHTAKRAAAWVGLVVAVPLLASCSSDDDDDTAAAAAGALAAAQVYVDAIADQDVETVDAMTDPAAFELAAGPDDDVDVRAALPDAVDPITDPWVSLYSPTHESQYGPIEFVLGVSYDVRDLTGGGTIVVALDDVDADPSDVDNWTVTAPLIVRGETFVDPRTVKTGRLGSVELTYGGSGDGHTGVWGYPGGYLLEPAASMPEVEPVWVAVGAADAPPWDDSLPRLELPGAD